MLAVNGYFDSQKYVTEHNVAVKPNQRVSITLLDEDFTEEKTDSGAQQKLEMMNEYHQLFC